MWVLYGMNAYYIDIHLLKSFDTFGEDIDTNHGPNYSLV